MVFRPPMPDTRPEGASLFRRLLLARKDIFASQPAHLYAAQMAQIRTPFYFSYLINQPDLVRTILTERPDDFPKSGIIARALGPLLGQSVFVTNGAVWKRQRRIIDPAFEGGRLRDTFPAMLAAGQEAVRRLSSAPNPVEMEFEASHLTADVIFRTLFSLPITDTAAREVFEAFRTYQRSQPLLRPTAFLKWLPRLRSRREKQSALRIRGLLAAMIRHRAAEIAAGVAPNDLATKIMTMPDPETGQIFSQLEMTDQVAIFFLAGHETSASALAWALYLLAADPDTQTRVANEVSKWPDEPDFADLRALPFTRDVFREALRLYPPVPMMLRETTRAERFRNRDIAPGSLAILSPWHLQRHERLWSDPHLFDPDRWGRAETRVIARDAYMPFSAGPRVCPGAGFAMAEGVLMLALLIRAFRFETVKGKDPKPVTHLTVRSAGGIYLRVSPRD